MSRTWVIDTSPLIVLAKASHAFLIPKLCPSFVIPLGVAEEILVGPAHDPARKWLSSIDATHIQVVDRIEPLAAAWDLGKGETQVLSWAYQHNECDAVIDDSAARKCALSLGISLRGTLGIVLLAKKEGHIPFARPIFEKLIHAGMRINAKLINSSLASVGE